MHYYQRKILLSFKDKNQQVLYKSTLADIPIEKHAFRDMCREIYASEEPCAMKQTAVLFRFRTQFDEYIQKCLQQSRQTDILWLDIPAEIRSWLHVPDACCLAVHTVHVAVS